MKISWYIKLLIVFPMLVCSITSTADYEQDIAEALSQRVEQGKVMWLKAENERFLGIYQEQSTEIAHGAAIIIHAMGGHPDWPMVISPLRIQLPKLSWSTLSIQMPVIAPGEPLADYGKTIKSSTKRINMAVQHLQDKGFRRIVIIGHSFGAAIIASSLAADSNPGIQAFVAISTQAQKFLSPTLNISKSIEGITVPILDIYGSRDFEEVLLLSNKRRQAGRKNKRRIYRQIVIEGADHYFTGLESIMVNRIRGWLDKVMPGKRKAR